MADVVPSAGEVFTNALRMKTSNFADRAGKAGAQQNDIYTRVTNIIIKRLEQGEIPWKKPWGSNAQWPRNYFNHRMYRGFNAMILAFAFDIPYYMTFKQVKELGGTVKKGSESTPVVYFDRVYRLKSTGERISAEKAASLPIGSYTAVPFLKYYNVFNVSQIDGIEFNFPKLPNNDIPLLDACEDIVQGMRNRPKIYNNGSEAYYSPPLDKIVLPVRSVFHTPEDYYATLFHELVHSTGHSTRLNRKEIAERTRFGSSDYSKEELVAELGACYLLCHADCQTEIRIDNSAAYIQSWLTKLKDDPKFILEASGKAVKAVEYIVDANLTCK